MICQTNKGPFPRFAAARRAVRVCDPPRNRMGFLLIGVALCMVSSVPSRAAEYVQKQGGATVRFEAEKDETGRVAIRLSDELHLTVSVEGGSALEVQPVQAITTSSDWQGKPASPPERKALAAGHLIWQQKFRLSPLKPGDLSVVLVPLRFRATPDSDRWEEIAWKPIPVHVSTEVYRAEVSELRDITPPEELPPALSQVVLLAWVALGFVALLLVLNGWLLYRRRRQESAVPPSQWAFGELQRIHLPADSTERELEEFYTQLSDVLRRYLELRYHLPAPEQTTAEFLEAMRRAPQLQPEQQAVVRNFLEQCDLVKFARAHPSGEECREAAETARALVQQTAADAVGPSDLAVLATEVEGKTWAAKRECRP